MNLPDVIPKTAKNTTKNIKKKTLKLKSPTVTLLRRESTKERIFHPPSSICVIKDSKDAFKGDFIGFTKTSKRPFTSAEDTRISYKKTKMEPMK